MRIQGITIVLLTAVAVLSGCSSTRQDSGFYRGTDGGVETSSGAFAARYRSWRISSAESADQTEVGVGVIAPLELPFGWSLKRRSTFGSDKVEVIVMDSEAREQQRFVAKWGSVYFLKTLKSKPLILAEDWQPQSMFDTQPPGPAGARSFEVYTKKLLDNSLH
jgi:hypothetical protein